MPGFIPGIVQPFITPGVHEQVWNKGNQCDFTISVQAGRDAVCPQQQPDSMGYSDHASLCPSLPAWLGHPQHASKHQSHITGHHHPASCLHPAWVCKQWLPIQVHKAKASIWAGFPYFQRGLWPHCGLSLLLFPSRGAGVPFSLCSQ